MKQFMDENFLLSNETAVRLYHDYAKNMPIYDYHCHLNPKEIWENKKYRNITEVWLGGDHYKWRAMRSNGVNEKYITGDASDYEKFMEWAKTMPYTIGNPLYHWTHLELQRFFGINDLLNEKNAPSIWEKANAMLQGEGFGARDLIEKSNVKMICTTDDPVDSLEYHKLIREEGKMTTKVLPACRPDKAVNINLKTFLPWLSQLEQVTGKTIKVYDDLLVALDERINFFHENGCRLSDHAFEYVPFEKTTKEEVAVIFAKALNKEELTAIEVDKYKTNLMQFFGKKFAKLNWTMQLHIGALRDNNARMFAKLGPDTGFDASHDHRIAEPLSRFLSSLDEEDTLPRTILYTLNPKDNYVLGTLMGCFQGGTPGKIQFGSGWWFLDQKTGMTEQMTTLSSLGLLSRFVGMLTDSRSFLSYPRHEYFRRILCNLIGTWVENGEFPNDMTLLGEIVQNISFNNANNYFNM
jgi:glucuronate isomerase